MHVTDNWREQNAHSIQHVCICMRFKIYMFSTWFPLCAFHAFVSKLYCHNELETISSPGTRCVICVCVSCAFSWLLFPEWVLSWFTFFPKSKNMLLYVCCVVYAKCCSLCGPAISWPLVQGVTLPLPYDSLDELQQSSVTLSSERSGI